MKLTVQKISVNKFERNSIYKIFRSMIDKVNILSHENIVQFIDCYIDSDKIAILSEHIQGKTLDKILNDAYLNIKDKINILHDIAKGMQYLHDHKPPIVHTHLNLSSIVVNQATLKAKVNDYIIFNVLSNDSITDKIDTLHKNANLIKEREEIKGDVYNFANIMWEVFNIQKRDTKTSFIKFKQGKPDMTNLDIATPNELLRLMQSCWDKNYYTRPSFNDITNTFRIIK